MEITGKVIAKPVSDSGISSRGPWKKAYLVIRYEDSQFPKDIVLYNIKKAEDFERIRVGDSGTFRFDARTRQGNNGKWFCDLECWSWSIDTQNGNSRQNEPF